MQLPANPVEPLQLTTRARPPSRQLSCSAFDRRFANRRSAWPICHSAEREEMLECWRHHPGASSSVPRIGPTSNIPAAPVRRHFRRTISARASRIAHSAATMTRVALDLIGMVKRGFAAALVSAALAGCASAPPLSPEAALEYKRRAVDRSDGEVSVSIAVLSAEESATIYGVPLATRSIQP